MENTNKNKEIIGLMRAQTWRDRIFLTHAHEGAKEKTIPIIKKTQILAVAKLVLAAVNGCATQGENNPAI